MYAQQHISKRITLRTTSDGLFGKISSKCLTRRTLCIILTPITITTSRPPCSIECASNARINDKTRYYRSTHSGQFNELQNRQPNCIRFYHRHNAYTHTLTHEFIYSFYIRFIPFCTTRFSLLLPTLMNLNEPFFSSNKFINLNFECLGKKKI